MSYVLYRHTSPSGKMYIGITSTTPERRWRNGAGYKGCPAFYNAINKYGWENIEHEVLLTDLDRETAEKREREYISKYNTLVPYGYNLETGGNLEKEISKETREKLRKAHTNPSQETREKISAAMRGRKFSDETRQKMSESFKGRKLSPQARKNISDAKKGKRYSPERCAQMSITFGGKNNPMYGRHHSDETKEKIAATKRGANNSNARKVICINDGKTFDTIIEASKYYGVSKSGVQGVCAGDRRQVRGLVFAYD